MRTQWNVNKVRAMQLERWNANKETPNYLEAMHANKDGQKKSEVHTRDLAREQKTKPIKRLCAPRGMQADSGELVAQPSGAWAKLVLGMSRAYQWRTRRSLNN